jgi:hypothetical protein
MRFLNFVLFVTIVLVCTACGSNNTYYLMTDDAQGLEAGDPVFRQGISIGEVEDVRFEGNEVQIEISIEESLYENQDFRIRDNGDGHQLALDRPSKNASALADGAMVKDDYLGEDILQGLEGLGKGLGEIGEAFGNAFERTGEDLEFSLEEWAKGIEKAGEDFGEAMEDWAEEHEEDLEAMERDFEKWADENEEEVETWEREMEEWGENFEGDIDDLINDFKQISQKHKIGSDTWKREVKKMMKGN